MTSPQTKSRDNKIQMFKESIGCLADLLAMNKDNLDSIDSRSAKKIVEQLRSWKQS
jgi:hypothetical protein